MADNRTMAQLLQAPTKGYEDAIVIPEINANFELKHDLINLVQNKQFFGHDKEDPHAHIRYCNKITSTMRFPDVPSTSIKLMLFSFSLEDTFYNALNANDQDSLNSAAGGNFLDKMPRECLRIIESKSKVRNSRNKAVVAKVSSNSSTPGISPDVADYNRTTDGNVYRDNIQEYVSQAAAANFNQGNTNSRPPMVANQIRPPGFPPIQNNQNRFNQNQGSNFNQNRGTNFNQNRGNNFNQGQVYQPPTNQTPVYQAPAPQMQGVSKTDFENYVKANDAVLRNMQNQGQGLQNRMTNLTEMLSKFINSNTALSSSSGTLPSQTVTNPREHVNAIITRSGKTCKGPSTPHFPTLVVSTPLKEPEQTPEMSMDKVQKPGSESTAQVPPLEDQDSIFIEIPKPRAKKTVQEPNSPEPNSYQPKLLYPERMKVREKDTPPSTQQSMFMKLFKQLRLELGLKDALIEMPKFNKCFSPVKTSDNLEEFADELTLLDSFPPGNDDSVLKKDVHEENFQVYSNPLFEFDDHFTSSNVNPLFNEMVEDVENENSNVSNSDEPVLLNTPLSDKVECSDPEVDIDEIDAFLAMEVSSNFEEGYYDSEGDVIFLESLFSDDTTHNLSPEVIFDHEPKQNESIHNTSITFSPRSDPLYHEFAGEIITLPSRIAREHKEYLSHMPCFVSFNFPINTESFHANPSSIITSPIPVQEEIDIFSGDLIPPGVENDDSEDEDNSTFLPEHESPNLDHQDNPSAPRPPPEPPDVKIRLEPDTAVINNFDVLNKEACFNLEEGVQIFLPFFTYPEDSPFILSFGSEDLVFDPGIFIFHFSYLESVVFSMEVSYSKYCSP
ncbi:hypothetical protein Tco_0255669 [Tanacetum coccineum]